MKTSFSHGGAVRARGFSLTELLVVVSIIGFLAAVSIPAFNNVVRSSSLLTSVQAVVGQFNLARQTALSRNASVEVRLYKLPHHGEPATSAPAVYRALQIFRQEEGVAQPLGKPVYFSPQIVCLADTKVSSIMDDAVAPETAASDGVKLGGFGRNYRYRSFRFRSSGSTDLPDQSIHLTLAIQNDRVGSGGLPANYVTIQVDPVTGRVRTFRP